MSKGESKRDDFSAATRRKLAGRAGNVCSVLTCRLPTQGAATGSDDVVDVGIAAHITAAAPGGPRYDPTLTSQQRREAANGIWCCTIHGKVIDDDEEAYPVEKLRQWKAQAEEASARALLSLQRTPGPDVGVEEADRRQLERLGLPAADDLASVTRWGREAALGDLHAFQAALHMPAYAVELDLRWFDGHDTTVFTAAGFASAVRVFNHLTVVAAPGTGKTTTLLQATQALLERDDLVAVFVPLGEWSTQAQTLLQSITERNAFSGLRSEHLKLLAIHGRLVLVLDGWNELSRESAARLRGELSGLGRDFPNLCTLMSTRRQALDVPRSGPVVEIGPLSEQQQRVVAHALRGATGESLLDQAWRTAGVRDLVSIPLYLSAILAHTSGERLPTTKEEVFRLFIAEHERGGERTDALHAAIQGFHPQMLEALAVEATFSGNPALRETQALKSIGLAEQRLVDEYQLTSAPQPRAVLDALIAHHLLVRSSAPQGAVTFQHQQFQEYYASAEVERLMRAAVQDRHAHQQLRRNILNEHAWEEAILFACERASRSNAQDVAAVALAVREALAIDPMLAAEMIYRSSIQLWEAVKGEVIAFAGRWHTPGIVDRAVRFMINTGRGEFAPMVWPLISDPDVQTHLKALRAGRRFRISVLDTNAEDRVRRLPEEVRQHVLAEIVVQGGFEGIEFASQVALTDPAPAVRANVIEYLLFRGAARQARNVLQNAPDEVWQLLARKGFHTPDLHDAAIAERLERVGRELDEAENNPLQRLSRLVHNPRIQPDAGDHIQELIETPELKLANDFDAGGLIREAFQKVPEAVRRALIHRLERRLDMPIDAHEMLTGSHVSVDTGPIVERILSADTDKGSMEAAAAIMGSQTIGRLIDTLLATAHQPLTSGSQRLAEERRHLKGLIWGCNPGVLAQAVIERAGARHSQEIVWMAQLLAYQGRRSPDRSKSTYDPALRDQLIPVLRTWTEVLLAAPNVTRFELSDMAAAVGRLATPELLPTLKTLLNEDLKRWAAALAALDAARAARKPIQNDAHMAYTLQYRKALVSIGGDDVVEVLKQYLPERGHGTFGLDAASALYELWQLENAPPRENHRFGRAFAQVRSQRQARQAGEFKVASPGAEAIFTVVDGLVGSPDETAQRHALQLASIALGMPCGQRAETIERLLTLSQPPKVKRQFLMALVLAGEKIPADLVLEGLRELLGESKSQARPLDPYQGPLTDWLVLLPFSDRPTAVIEAVASLPQPQRTPRQLGPLVIALGDAPSDEALQVLETLVREDEALLEDSAWFQALERREIVPAMRLLLKLLEEGKLENRQRGVDQRQVVSLAALIRADSAFRRQVYDTLERLPGARSRGILESAIAEAVDREGVFLLLRGYARRGQGFDHVLYAAIEQLAIDRRPSSEWVATYELIGRAVPELRKSLFSVIVGRAPEAELAATCLNTIDELRDDHGPAEAEPRHPDIDSGLSWPLPKTLTPAPGGTFKEASVH